MFIPNRGFCAVTHTRIKNDDFGAISVTKLTYAAPTLKVNRHPLDRFLSLFIAM